MLSQTELMFSLLQAYPRDKTEATRSLFRYFICVHFFVSSEFLSASISNLVPLAAQFQTVKSREKSIWVLQDSCTNSYESAVVYAPVDINTTQLVIAGHDPSNIQILPSGFSIIPDGVESRPLVITSTQEDRNTQGGSLLTLALQTLVNPSPAAKLNMESVESVTNLVSLTLHNIKTSLQIEDC